MDVAAPRLSALLPSRSRGLLLVAALLAAVSAAAALVPALVLAYLASILFEHADDFFTIMQMIFTVIAFVVVRLAASIYARVAAAKAAKFASLDLRGRAAAKIGTLALGDLAALRPGSLETLLLDDVERVGDALSVTFVDAATAYAMLAFAGIVLVVRDWRIALVVAGLSAAAWCFFRVAGTRDGAELGDERLAREDLAAAVFRSIRSFSLARSVPAAPDAAQPLAGLAHAYRVASERRLVRGAVRSAQYRAVAVALPAVAVLALVLIDGARVAPATIVLVAAVTLRVTGALAATLAARTAAAPARDAARRIVALFVRPSPRDGDGTVPGDTTIRFTGVRFAYGDDGGRDAVLRDVSFTAEAGKVTALVGPSGSGKTTVTRLAARFWDADAGTVSLGGVDVRALPLDALMNALACVFQDVALLDDTVAVNLKLGRPDADDAAMVRAAEAAGAHAFISALPAGYDTVVGDRGLRLSRGERQRLQIARALLKDAPVVILDEPTASLDPATEVEIEDALVPLLRERTVLVVAHRLPTIAHADSIVVLDRNGAVEAQGTHAQLLARSPTYAALWRSYAGDARRIGAGETMAVG